MPSRERRREFDLRSGRFESEIRDAEMAKGVLVNRTQLPKCSRCNRVFEEISKVCPRCETRTMGYIRPIPEKYLDEARRNSLRRLRAK